MDRFSRFYAFHQQLAGARVPKSAAQLMRAMECSAKTLKRTIQEMREYFRAPIHFDRSLGGYVYRPQADGRPFELPGLWFSAAELHALLSCQQLLHGIGPGLLDDHLAPLRDRIDELLKLQRLKRGQLERRVRVLTAAHRSPKPEVFSPVAAAVLQRQRLRFEYHGRGTNRRSQRHVSPQRLCHYRDNWYLDAWDHDKDALRTFSLDRIATPDLSDERAIDVDEAELKALLTDGYGIFAGRARASATLRFSAEAARWVADEQWHPKQQGGWLPDGRYELVVPYAGAAELVMDILRHGEHVEVVSPEELRWQVRVRLEAAVAQYRETATDCGPRIQ